MKPLRILCSLVCLTMLTACPKKKSASEASAGKLAEAPMENDEQGNVSLDFSKGEFNIKTPAGQFQFSNKDNVKMPEGFPGDVPVYKGSRAVQSMSTPEGASVTLMTADARPTVVAYYRSHLGDSGWVQESSMELPRNDVHTFKRKDSTLSLMVADGQGETVINMTVSNGR